MKTALFTNFSDQPFTGYWGGKGKTFKPGQSVYMPDYLAAHFAKYLANQELLSMKPDGSPKYKDGEKMTSPKKPQDVPLFMELFNKAYMPEETEEDMLQDDDPIDTAIATANKNRERASGTAGGATQNPNEPQIVLPPADDEDGDEGDESTFPPAPPAQGNVAPQGLSL